MNKKFALLLAFIMVFSLVVPAFASDVDCAVVDVTTPLDSVTLAEGDTSTILIKVTVSGKQDGTASFKVFKDWTLVDGIFVGSNPEFFTIAPRVATDANENFNLTGLLKVTSVPAEDTYTLMAKAENITNTNGTGAKLGVGKKSDYDVVVDNPAPPADTTAPVITLNGAANVTVEVHGSFTDAGAVVSDNLDADRIIMGVGTIDLDTVNIYTLTYSATDASGNAALPVTRTINVVDTTKPVITLIGEAEVNVEAKTAYTELGATANDNYDGILTDSIVIDSNVNVNVKGIYHVTYNVSDASGNAAVQVTRTVNVVDTTKPVITLIGEAEVNVEAKTAYTELGATANDNYDGILTDSIVIDSNVNVNVKGIYHVTYNVSDASGNAAVQVTRTVNVVDTTKPVITLIGEAVVTVKIGATYTELGATANDNYDGDITANIITKGTVDTSKIGSYKITFDVNDASGNAAAQVVRTINVVYDFKGFLQPIDMNGVVNSMKAGSAVPIKFSLGGDMGLTVFATGYPTSALVKDFALTLPTDIVESQINTAGNSVLTYDAATGQYTYVWKTDKAWAGTCRQLNVRFNDGTIVPLVNFKFSK